MQTQALSCIGILGDSVKGRGVVGQEVLCWLFLCFVFYKVKWWRWLVVYKGMAVSPL